MLSFQQLPNALEFHFYSYRHHRSQKSELGLCTLTLKRAKCHKICRLHQFYEERCDIMDDTPVPEVVVGGNRSNNEISILILIQDRRCSICIADAHSIQPLALICQFREAWGCMIPHSQAEQRRSTYLYLNVCCLALCTTQRLMDHDARVCQ